MGDSRKIFCHCYSAKKKLDKAIINEPSNSDENKNTVPTSLSYDCSNEMEFSKTSTEPYDITTSTSSSPKTIRTSICVQKKRHSISLNKKHKIDDLKKDLTAIKNQLLFLTRNKAEALKIAEELQIRYKKLLKHKYKQKQTIYRLKSENLGLNMIIRKMASGCLSAGGDSEDVVGVKQKLDMYEVKMSELYNECINSLKMMQDCRDKINFAITLRSEQYRELSDSNRELCEIIENKKKKCCELEMQCCRLQKEKDSYQSHCYSLAKNIDELQTSFDETTAKLAVSQEETVGRRVLEEKEETIQELNSIIEKLQNQISEKKIKEKETEDLRDRYNQVLSQNKELMHKLDRISESSNKRCSAAVEKIKSLKDKQSKLLQEQKKLILQMDKFNCTLKEKEKFILNLKRSNDEKDMMIQRQKEDIVDMLQRSSSLTDENKSEDQAYTCSSSDSCFSLTKELETLVNSLYAEIDKTLVKDKIIQEQFEHNCFLKCSLSSKEAELSFVKEELKRVKNGLQKNNSDGSGIDSEESETETTCVCEDDDSSDEEDSEEDDWLNKKSSSDGTL